MKLSKNAQNAFMLGTLCSIAYFAVYIVRNILSAVTPAMVELGYTEAYIGSISSLFFVFYDYLMYRWRGVVNSLVNRITRK